MSKTYAMVDTIEDTKEFTAEATKKMKDAADKQDSNVEKVNQSRTDYQSLEQGQIKSTLTQMAGGVDSAGEGIEGGAESPPPALLAQVSTYLGQANGNMNNFKSQFTSQLKSKLSVHTTNVKENEKVVKAF